MSEITETQPNLTKNASPTGGRKGTGLRTILFGVLGMLALAALGILGGYFFGISQRLDAQKTQITRDLQDQFDLGNKAMDAGQYEVARQHFQYVIDHNPNFPGVQTAYTQLLIRMQTTPTPTFTLTPTITNTPDLSSINQLYSHLHDLLTAKPQTIQDWTAVIGQLDSIRNTDAAFHAEEIDGDYYTALRQRGVLEIVNSTCADINLEAGIYDLTLASNFGPLDSLADSYRTYSRLYISGATFWELDWGQAQYYFGQVANALPNLMDSSCQTATNRWAYATVKVADQLWAAGNVCPASDQYNAAMSVDSPASSTAAPTAEYANGKCHPPKPKPPTATPEVGTPVDTPTATP